ncbi:hypothetical protein V8F33_005221 [Rhypophila sp. PSN 637]
MSDLPSLPVGEPDRSLPSSRRKDVLWTMCDMALAYLSYHWNISRQTASQADRHLTWNMGPVCLGSKVHAVFFILEIDPYPTCIRIGSRDRQACWPAWSRFLPGTRAQPGTVQCEGARYSCFLDSDTVCAKQTHAPIHTTRGVTPCYATMPCPGFGLRTLHHPGQAQSTVNYSNKAASCASHAPTAILLTGAGQTAFTEFSPMASGQPDMNHFQ